MRQYPGILEALRGFLLLNGGPALATAVHGLLPSPLGSATSPPAPTTAPTSSDPAAVPPQALRLALHLSTLCAVVEASRAEERFPCQAPLKPKAKQATTTVATEVLAHGLLPDSLAPPPSAHPCPCPRWLERTAASTLSYRGAGTLPPSAYLSPLEEETGGGEGTARALRALARALAMREQGAGLGPMHAVFQAGGTPALLSCLLAPVVVHGDGAGGGAGGGTGQAEAAAAEAAAAKAAAAIATAAPVVGNGNGRKRGRSENGAATAAAAAVPTPGPGPVMVAVPQRPSAVVNGRGRPAAAAAGAGGAVTGCAMCGARAGQGETGGLLRCARCKAVRYCSRGEKRRCIRCVGWDGYHRAMHTQILGFTTILTSPTLPYPTHYRLPGAPLEGGRAPQGLQRRRRRRRRRGGGGGHHAGGVKPKRT